MALKYKTIKAKSVSYGSKRDYDQIKYIVIHYTGNKGDTAKNNADYFANGNTRAAGAHYFVDGSGTVYKSVPVTRVAWAVGGLYTQSGGAGSMYKKITNANSVSIEMCNCANSVPDKVFDDAVALTKHCMKEFGIPASHVYRHWDVNGKSCPAPWAKKDSSGWKKFKKAIQETSTTKTISTGSKVKIKSGAVYGGASAGKKVGSAYIGKKYTVSKVQTNGGQKEALIKELNSWIPTKYLTAV